MAPSHHFGDYKRLLGSWHDFGNYGKSNVSLRPPYPFYFFNYCNAYRECFHRRYPRNYFQIPRHSKSARKKCRRRYLEKAALRAIFFCGDCACCARDDDLIFAVQSLNILFINIHFCPLSAFLTGCW